MRQVGLDAPEPRIHREIDHTGRGAHLTCHQGGGQVLNQVELDGFMLPRRHHALMARLGTQGAVQVHRDHGRVHILRSAVMLQ
jgi:hypothetical protein